MMEATPNFALPNQFLVWVAKKVLTHCDLDLVLTDYYKKRLESQLKNRETDTKTPVLTELNESTGLQLPTDWTLCTKPSPLRPSYFPPSPPPSPLSLSSNLTLSSATPLTSQFSFRPNSPPPSLNYPSVESCTSEMTSITNETKMTKQCTPTPDSIPLAPVVQIPYIMAMPYPGTPGTPFFEGSNVTGFLTRYELMCSDFRMEEKEKIRRLPLYCEMFIGKYIESVIQAPGITWSAIRKALRSRYKDRDLNQQIYSRRFLESYKDKVRSDSSDILHYCDQFASISENLVAKSSIDTFIQSRWFIQGLPPSIRAELFSASNMDSDDDLELDFQELLKKTIKIVKLRKKLSGMVKSDEKNSQVSDLVDRYDEEALISSPPNPSAPLPASTFKLPIAVPSSNLITRSEDTNVKQLTEIMQSLALSVHTIQTYLGQTQIGAAQSLTYIPQYPSNTGSTKPLSAPGFGTGVDKCLYCWSREHYLTRDCPAFQEDLNNNCIHLNKDKKVCLGTYLPGIRPVYIRREKSGRDCVADAEKLRYPSLPPANVQILKIGELEPDLCFIDEESEYISLDEPIGTEVLAACNDEPKPTLGLLKEPAKRILRRHIQKKKEYATPKNVRFGE